MHKCLASVFILLFIGSKAQDKIKIVNSGELIREGIEYYEDGKFDKALLKYKQVPENDTNYALAVYETGLTYNAQKNHTKAIEVFEQGLKIESNIKTDFIQQLGNSYSLNKQLDQAIITYRNGLKKYPYYFRFYYEMAAASYLDNKPKEALALLDSCLKINFVYGRAHFLMGEICEKNNYFIPAILSYQMAAYLSYGSQVGLSSLFKIQSIANGEIKVNKDSIVDLFASGENNFDEIDEIIRSQSELDEKYKVKPAVNLPFNALIKCLHLVNNRISLNPDGSGWYYENLVPIYIGWWKKKEFPIVMYRIAASIDNEQAKKMYLKNKVKIEKHYGDFYNDQLESRFTYYSRMPEFKGVYKHLYTFKSQNLFALVPEGEEYDFNKGVENRNGLYIYFHNNGEKKSIGSYKDNVSKGIWKYYDEKGYLIKEVNYISDVEFKRNTYYSNGQIETSDHYKDGKYVDVYITYYANGIMQSKMELKNGEIDGEVTTYYNNGQLNKKTKYEKGKVKDAEEVYYHRNGALQVKLKYKNGKREGKIIEYFDNGNVMLEMTYKDDKPHGNYKEYHRNGKLKIDKNYVDGEYDGSFKEYHSNGVLAEDANYSKGENKGKSFYYDTDGKLFAEYLENKGKIKYAIYYNKKGEKIYEVDAQKNELNLQIYNQVGIKVSEGKVKKDFRVGEWKFYTKCGALETIKEYDDKGNFNGKVESYIVGDILDEKYDMKDNQLDGYYIEYYNNGKKYREGNYVAGEKEGVWKTYFKNGEISQDEYYIEGSRTGILNYYYANGKIKGKEEYRDGFLYKLTAYDTSGNYIGEDTIGFPYGNLIINHKNGKPRINNHYKNGRKEGTQYWYWANGNLRSKEEYRDGYNINYEYNYYANGKLNNRYKYINGELDSTYIKYDDDGKLVVTKTYHYDELNGEEINYQITNGKVETKGNYIEGDREGWFYYYAADGAVQYRMLYHLGIELAYSYLDKSGKFVDSIPLKNASGDITCYFQNGNVSATFKLVNGSRHGVYTKYFSNGKKQSEANYHYGFYHGLYTEYNENGKLKYQGNFVYGHKNGIETNYDNNGKIIRETSYDTNMKHGPDKFYSNGKLVKTINYFFDDTEDL